MTSATTETHDLRTALQAVAGHASRFPDDAVLHRVRLTFDRLHLTVTATNRYSAALAIASVWSDPDLDPDHLAVDLHPRDVAQVLAVFTGKPGKDGEVGDTVRVDVTAEEVVFTDTGGLFEGKSLHLPRLPMHELFPNVASLVRVGLDRPAELGPDDVAAPVWTSPRLLSLFRAAGTAYGHPLILEPTGGTRSVVIRCGESFVGLLMPVRPADDDAARAADWRHAWLDRLDPTDSARAASWLREGWGVVIGPQQDVAVSIGEAMVDDARAQLAAAVRVVVEDGDARASHLKRRLRVSIAEARAVLARLVELEVVAVDDEGPRVLVAPADLDVCLSEHGLAGALAAS